MGYKCLTCGHIFDFGEEKKIKECVGYYGSSKAYETYCVCPSCGGKYEETTECIVCGSKHLENELTDGVCEDCIEEYSKDVDFCFEAGKNEKENVELNLLLTTVFSEEEIENILIDKIKKENIDISKFAKDDLDWFAGKIAEKERESN